jgi:hypothetical protein
MLQVAPGPEPMQLSKGLLADLDFRIVAENSGSLYWMVTLYSMRLLDIGLPEWY